MRSLHWPHTELIFNFKIGVISFISVKNQCSDTSRENSHLCASRYDVSCHKEHEFNEKTK